MRIGYTTGVFDLFHVGHLKILQSAKALCDRLIVGVTTDELAFEYKHKRPIIPFSQRIEIIRAIGYVDTAIRREVMDKQEEWKRLKFDVVFVGDDWLGRNAWETWGFELAKFGVEIIYLPHTPGVSTTSIMEAIKKEK